MKNRKNGENKQKPILRPICDIAREIKQKWPRPYFGAVPYLDAMLSLRTKSDMYGMDDAKGIVLYFLANAHTWRGEDARRIKVELREVVK